jgi:hypothetical protein
MRRLLVPFLVAAAAASAQTQVKTFPHPDRIRYDGECLTVDGRDLVVFSGTFHYFRCPKPLWPDRFRKIKEAGFNAVETYVPWNLSEPRPPSSLDDYSQVDLTDLKDWLHMAQDEFGLYTIVRPGPYICAEWDGGGFPRWLLTKMPAAARRLSGGTVDVQLAAGADAAASARASAPPSAQLWLRSDDPSFLAWSEHWLKAVCPVIVPELVTHRAPGTGGVILFQIENEYDLYHDIPEAERVPHLKALYETAVSQGIDVPIFTCWTKQCRDSSDPELSQVFDAFNDYPRFKIDATADRIHALQAAQTDAPVMISELQGGWFSGVGGKLAEDQPGLTAAQINANTLIAIQEGATILNYYVLFGGTNFGLWAGRGITTDYDYDAPIRQPGGVGDKYLAVKAIGLMLQQHGSQLARSHPIVCQAESDSPDVTVAARRARDGSTFVFVRNHSLTHAHRGAITVWLEKSGDMTLNYDLGVFGYSIFYLPPGGADPAKGEWLLQPVAAPARPTDLPSPVRVSSAQVQADPGGADWVEPGPGDMLPELGVYDSRPVVYAASLDLAAAQVDPADTLRVVPYLDDSVVADVNGHIVAFGLKHEVAVGSWLHEGANSIRVLYNQHGQANFGRTMQDEAGLRSASLGTPSGNLPIGGWKVARSLGGTVAGWPDLAAGAGSGWATVPLDTNDPVLGKGGIDQAPAGRTDALATWYRVEFSVPEAKPGVWVPWGALIDAAGDGELFLNGHPLGRYWEVGPQRTYYLPECWINFGAGAKNVLTLQLSPVRKGVALRAVEVAPYAEQAEFRR